MLQPFAFGPHKVVLPLCRSREEGNEADELGNSIMASEPGHPFWEQVIRELKEHPPTVQDYSQVVDVTGPGFLTRMYRKFPYPDIHTPAKKLYHPPMPGSRKALREVRDSLVAMGIHHPWGSWKERWSWAYWRKKVGKVFGL